MARFIIFLFKKKKYHIYIIKNYKARILIISNFNKVKKVIIVTKLIFSLLN